MRRSARTTRASRTAPTAGRRSLPVVTQAISDSDGDNSDSSEEMPTLPQRSPVIKLTAATGAATIGNKKKQTAERSGDIYFPSLFWRNVSPEDLYPENKETVYGKLNELLYDSIRRWELK